jgi:hypothetical protein
LPLVKTSNARRSFALALLISAVAAAPAAAAGTLTVKKSPQDDATTIIATKPVRNADGAPTGAQEEVLECGSVCAAAVPDAFGRPDNVTLVSKPAAGWGLLRWSGCTPDGADMAVCRVDMKTDRAVTASYQDVGAPRARLSGPVDGAAVHGTVELSATAVDNARVTAVRFFLDGALIATDDAPPYRASFSTLGRTHGAKVTVEARAIDTAGLQSDVVDGVNRRTYVVDNGVSARFVAPTPAEGAVVRTAAPSVAFAIDPDGAPAGGSFECAVNGRAPAPCDSPFVPSTTADASYSVDVRVSDAALPTPNQATITRRFVVDRTAPAVRIVTPADGSRLAGPFTPSFTVQDSNPDRVACRLDGAAASCTQAPALVQGPHAFEVVATDRAGNATTVTSRFAFDGGAPTVTHALSPEQTASGWQRGDVTVRLSADDPSGVREIAYRATGAQPIAPTTRPGATASVLITAEGRTTLAYRATDAAGNAAVEQEVTVRIDRTPPRVTITSPAAGATLRQGETVAAAYVCEDPEDDAGLTGCRGDVPPAAPVETATTGEKAFSVSAVDAAGNTTTRTVGYTVAATSVPERPSPTDADGDGVPDGRDNCPVRANGDQVDRDADGIGDACELLPPGDLPVVMGEVARVRQISGEVYVRLPGARLQQAAPAAGFVPLKGVATVPIGTEVDARRGSLDLTTAAGSSATGSPHLQTARLAAGIFKVKQARRARRRARAATTDLLLETPPGSAAACTGPRKGVVRSLSGSAKGSFRTIGAASTTTITDATWIVQDRCDGTLTQIGRGRATVYDPRRRTNARLMSGQAYLVRARLFAAVKGSARARTPPVRDEALLDGTEHPPAQHDIAEVDDQVTKPNHTARGTSDRDPCRCSARAARVAARRRFTDPSTSAKPRSYPRRDSARPAPANELANQRVSIDAAAASLATDRTCSPSSFAGRPLNAESKRRGIATSDEANTENVARGSSVETRAGGLQRNAQVNAFNVADIPLLIDDTSTRAHCDSCSSRTGARSAILRRSSPANAS